jgi:hypothetical protein
MGDIMVFLFEYDRNGGWRAREIERVGPMVRLIWGWWSVAHFKRCGINDLSHAFRAHERDLLVKQGRLASAEPAD